MLTPETKAVWEAIREVERFLNGFVLIGGTALALRIHHRYSEDLDFAFAGTKLPREAINQLGTRLTQTGFKITPNDSVASLIEAETAGADLHDSHQDFVVNDKVKLTFVCQAQDNHIVLGGKPTAPFRIATVDEIFKLKCIVTARRSKSRDWFDLYTLFTKHGYGMNDLRAAFASVGQTQPTDIAIARLCSCAISPLDEGYAQLTQHPPTPEEMAKFFQEQLKKNEIELTQATLRKAQVAKAQKDLRKLSDDGRGGEGTGSK